MSKMSLYFHCNMSVMIGVLAGVTEYPKVLNGMITGSILMGIDTDRRLFQEFGEWDGLSDFHIQRKVFWESGIMGEETLDE